MPLFEQLAIEGRTRRVGISNNLALSESEHQLFRQTPLQDPAKGDRHDMVKIYVMELDDLMRNRRPENADSTRMYRDALTPNQISERAPIEKIDLDFVVPIGPWHLPRLPDFAGKAVRREIASPAVEMVHDLGFGLDHGLSIVPKLPGIQGDLNNSLSHTPDTLSDLGNP